MTMTVKKLISELEKIDNKFLEVETIGSTRSSDEYASQIKNVKLSGNGKKVLILIK